MNASDFDYVVYRASLHLVTAAQGKTSGGVEHEQSEIRSESVSARKNDLTASTDEGREPVSDEIVQSLKCVL
ncbi:unnamed protein product [Heligmosomoides polygyrus]|uniref:Uncharacterized protein n=1 Tax=Heligmosomoides polygyrus TaxID=6339 RepID=A0A3P7TCQ7_HELPZ|nr:unnamed protein product [Heligmosomoides polygyrus]